MNLLARKTPDAVRRPRGGALDAEALEVAQRILDDVAERGDTAVLEHARRLGELGPDEDLWLERDAIDRMADTLDREALRVLASSAKAIERFARAQRESLSDVTVHLATGRAGQRVLPVDCAGAYAPGGRHPLPSSVLMTAVTARAAGVPEIVVASPRPAAATVAAARLAGAERLLRVGGAQAIAAMAMGTETIPSVAVIGGPGNRFVTAAKYLVSREVRIDQLAGPSELLIVASPDADPEVAAADLLAQAEHDPDAVPMLVALDATWVERVEAALSEQLEDLPTAEVARAALTNGFAVVCDDVMSAITCANALAAEHLQIVGDAIVAEEAAFTRYGGLFVGESSAEVFGDYGVGPNHTLPTGGTARARGGLAVFDFLAIRTTLHLEDGAGTPDLVRDTAALARLEGLEAHARAAEWRVGRPAGR